MFGALAVALVFVGAGPGRSPTVLAAGSAFGAAALVLVALRNMEHFVVATLVLRTALDGLHVHGHAASTDPATALGALFVVVSLLWLAARRAQGRRHPLSATGVALVAFLIAVGLATLGSEAPVHSLAEAARLATAVLMFFVVDRLCEDTGRPHRIVLAILAAAVVPLTVALAGPFVGFHRTEMKDGISRIISTFAQSNPFGHFLTIVVLILGAYVLVRRGREQWLALAALAPVGLALVLTYTRLAWAGAVVGVLVMVWVAGRRWLAPTLLVVLVGAAALTPGIGHRLDQLTSGTVPGAESGTDWRIGQWAEVARLGGHNPVTGIGPNVVALRLANHQPPHNDYLARLRRARFRRPGGLRRPARGVGRARHHRATTGRRSTSAHHRPRLRRRDQRLRRRVRGCEPARSSRPPLVRLRFGCVGGLGGPPPRRRRRLDGRTARWPGSGLSRGGRP